MAISNVSSALNTLRVSEAGTVGSYVGVKMLHNTLEQDKTEGENLTKMMELSVNPEIGSNFDERV
ncbi:MAG: YjfB family protein [Clostridiales bacterium]|nr:YjfB family protein [Clostridiales bacterium]